MQIFVRTKYSKYPSPFMNIMYDWCYHSNQHDCSKLHQSIRPVTSSEEKSKTATPLQESVITTSIPQSVQLHLFKHNLSCAHAKGQTVSAGGLTTYFDSISVHTNPRQSKGAHAQETHPCLRERAVHGLNPDPWFGPQTLIAACSLCQQQRFLMQHNKYLILFIFNTLVFM